jgi:hypothetical protein
MIIAISIFVGTVLVAPHFILDNPDKKGEPDTARAVHRRIRLQRPQADESLAGISEKKERIELGEWWNGDTPALRGSDTGQRA